MPARVGCALVVGAVLAALVWLALRRTFDAPVFARTNVRGATVPVGAGIVAVLVVVLVAAFAPALPSTPLPLEWGYLVAAVGFGLLGFVDDLAGVGEEKGFRGHLRALAGGRLTTGGLKLAGGGVLALAIAASIDAPQLLHGATKHPWWIVPDAALVALCANLGNLFDRAPGRTTKVTAVAFVVLWATHPHAWLVGAALVVGAALGLFAFDLREELMLGDAGANAVGAVLAVGMLYSYSFPVRAAALVVVVGLNVASERVSFSKVIEAAPPLRALDRLGRRRP